MKLLRAIVAGCLLMGAASASADRVKEEPTDATRAMQLCLKHDGYYDGEIDGHWGPLTDDAYLLALTEPASAAYEKKLKSLPSGERRAWNGLRLAIRCSGKLYRGLAEAKEQIDSAKTQFAPKKPLY